MQEGESYPEVLTWRGRDYIYRGLQEEILPFYTPASSGRTVNWYPNDEDPLFTA